MKNIIIIGASGHGSVILDCIEKEGKYNVVGFVDSFKQKGTTHNGYEILGNEFEIPYLTKKNNLYGGIIAIGDNWTRKNVCDRITVIAPDFRFITSIHPKAVIGKDTYIGKGTVIMPGAIVNSNTVIKDFCILNTNSSLGHDSIIEEFSSIAPGVSIGGGFYLGTFSAVSIGAIIIENIMIREHTIIGAGSLVTKDFPEYIVAHGTPAKIIRTRERGEYYLKGTSGRTSNIPIYTTPS
ncbi:acetyltransferase [Aquimarina addita]|uniref:Acetyltransferase n=1 Tax=Aquimarina addita TaxID=870485 RepID=A0ABP6UNA1_9FLAO